MANIDRPIFPLLQLPKKAKKHVCRVMDPLLQLTLSTCHDVTKSLVKSTGLKSKKYHMYAQFIWIEFNDECAVFLHFLNNVEHLGFTNIRASYDLEPDPETASTVYKWTSPLLSIRGWIDHLLFVLNRDYIGSLGCEMVDLEFFQENFVGLDFDHLEIPDWPEEHILELINELPRLKHLELGTELPEDAFQKVLMQNLDSLEPSREHKLVLNHLLLCNSVHFNSFNFDLTPKDINRFVKLWMKGSNPRMKYIRVGFKSQGPILDKDLILKGTNHQDQAEDANFIELGLDREVEEKIVSGGYEINRIDGTKATIMIGRAIGNGDFKMCIWT